MNTKQLRIYVLKKNYLLQLKEWFYLQHQKTSKQINRYINRIKAPTPKRKEWFSRSRTGRNDFYISEMPICKTSPNIKTKIEGKTIYPAPLELRTNKATSPLRINPQPIIGQEKYYGINN